MQVIGQRKKNQNTAEGERDSQLRPVDLLLEARIIHRSSAYKANVIATTPQENLRL